MADNEKFEEDQHKESEENEHENESEQEEELDDEEPEELDDVERSRMPLTEHLEELRKRIFYSFLVIFAISAIAFVFIDPIFAVVQRPFQMSVDIPVPVDQINDLATKVQTYLGTLSCDDEACFTDDEEQALASMVELNLKMLSGLIFTHPVEGFFTFLKLAFYTGLLIGMPFLLVQIWRFTMPALYANEQGFFKYFLVIGTGLFFTGVIFCYMIVLPIGIDFLVGFGGDQLTPLFSIGNYISFSMILMIVFGLSFEVPLAMFILVKMGLVERQVFFNYWKHILVGAVVIGAVFTPPDPWTQLLMGGAVVVLYIVGLFVTQFAVPKSPNEIDDGDLAD